MLKTNASDDDIQLTRDGAVTSETHCVSSVSPESHTPLTSISTADARKRELCARLLTAIRLKAPWINHKYPGRTKLVRGVFRWPYSRQSIHNWTKGRTPVSLSAAEDILADLQAAVDARLPEIEYWTDYCNKRRAEPKIARGFLRVDEASGRDGRGHWKR